MAGRGWRQSDVESLGGISVSSSLERQAMREQLDAVRSTLNTLAGPGAGIAGPASGVTAAPGTSHPPLEVVLTDIASKLGTIEGLYGSLTERLDSSERHIKNLQHFSASTIHETARLVDYVGGRATTPSRATSMAGGAGSMGLGPSVNLRGRHMAGGVPTTPTPVTGGAAGARSALHILEQGPNHMGATLQQHAAQIHKLIAGLDFLEAHIIRQDQMVESLQKQVTTGSPAGVAADGGRIPSELSVRMHDMSELLNKLRSHMYKVEKKSAGGEQALAALTARLEALAERLRAVEDRGGGEGGAGSGSAHRSSHEGDLSSTQQTLHELASAQAELRGMVLDVGRDVAQLRDQVEAQLQQADSQPQAAGVSAAEGAEMRRQLAFLMAQVPVLVAENGELKTAVASLRRRLPDLDATRDQVDSMERELAALQSAAGASGLRGPAADVVADAAEEGLRRVAAVEEQLAGLTGRVEGLVSREELQSVATAAAAAEQELAALRERRETAAERRASMPGADAAALSAEVAAAAKADLMEHVGRMRERLEVSAAAAEAAALRSKEMAEEAAAQCTEAVEAAAARLAEVEASAADMAANAEEAVRKAGTAAAASAAAALQESVLAMVAGVEQEQGALKQQLANLAAQVSEEQAAISAGLSQVQEQVAAATSAAMDAATCAQLVQQAQAEQGSRADPTEALQEVQDQLREQVGAVMEGLKGRVEAALQQVDEQLAAAAAASEAALQELRGAAADAAERGDLALASVEGLRAELILLTGQADVTSTRLEALEAAVGVDPRSSVAASPLGGEQAAGRRVSASDLEEAAAAEVEAEALAAAEEAADAGGEEEEAEEDGAEGEDGAAAGGRSAARAAPRVAAQGGGGGGGGGGLLDLVAQLRARVGGLEGAVEAAAADMDGVRGQLVASKQDAEDAIQQATSRLASEVAGLTQAVGAMDERVASAASTFDSMAAASGVLQRRAEQQAASTAALEAQLQQLKVKLEEEVVDRVQETSQALASLTSRISRDYVNREQLGAIFQARADMKRAVDELASVFDTGRLVREASSDDVAVQAPSRSGSVAARNGNGEEGAVLSPRLVQALEDLAGKQAELEQQVKLALYRSESMVRHEQLNSIQQAMVTLEMQFRRMGAAPPASPQHPAALPPLPPASTAAVAAAAAAAEAAQQELAELRARVAALEAAVPSAATSGAAASPATAASHGLGQGHGAAGHHRRTASRDSAFVHLCLSPADPAAVAAGGESPLRVRLLVEAVSTQDGAGTDADMSVAEPSLSQLLVAEEAEEAEAGAGGEAEGTSLQAALAVAEEVRQLRGVLGDLTELCAGLQDQVTHAAESRKVLEETVSELQERLDSQVAATASSLALMATMATDQHDQHKQRSAARLETAARLEAAAAAGRSSRSLGLGLAVGGSEEGDDDGGEGLDTLSTLARTVNMLAARLQAAEDQLEAAFVVRTPRSPTSRAAVAAAAAAAAASAAAAAAAAAEVSGEEADVEADVEAAGAAEAGAEAAAGSGSGAAGAATSAEDDGEEEDEEGRVLGLGLMVPVVPREMERQLGALQGAVQELAAVVGRLGGRVESLEEAGALEDVRAAAAEVVLEAIPGAIAQQLESVLGRQAEQAADAARRAEAEADAARAAAAEAAAARETVEEVAVVVRGAVAVAEAAREAAAAREEAAAVALDAVESAVREAAVEAEAARNSVVDAEAARQAAQEAQAAAEAAAAVVAAAQPAAPASAGADPALAESLQAACVAAAVSAAREAAVEAAVLAARDAAAVATQRAVGAAQEAATEAIAAAAVRASSPRGRPDDAGVAAGLAAVTAEVKEVQSGLSSVTARLNDVDSLRDQLEALAEQVRYAAAVASAADANAAAAAADPSQPAPQSQAPDTPPFNSDGGSAAAATVAGMFSPSATAVIIPPSRTPRMSGAGASPMGGRAAGTAAATASQQAAFLARLVEVVKRQSGRLHAQYSDAEETGTALAAVDSRLDEAQAALAAADVRDVNSPAFAETLVTVLEQVAALRFIGSQTHPAVQQMVLHHENRLDEIAEQLKALATGLPASNGAGAAAADGGARPAADTGAATAALAEEVVGVVRRLGRLESELGTVAGHTAALDKALGSVLEAVRGLGAAPAPAPAGEEAQAEADQAAGNANANVAVAGFSSSASSVEVAALGAKVQLLEEVLESRLGGLREEVRAAIDTATGVAAGGGGGGGGGGLGMSLASASDLAALDGRVAALHTAASNMRNRLLAVQEYVDSTQGMIKDMHVAVGSLHRRIDGLEAAAAEQVGGGWGGGGAADGSGPASGRASVSGEPSSLKEVQSELLRLEHRLLAAEGSALESAHGLASLKALAPRLAEAEARLADASGKLAAALGGSGSASSGIPAPPSGVTLPSVAAGLRALERRVACRLEAGVVALEGLTGALGAASRIERESTANPFKAISAAVNNPVVAALEKKVEAVRAELAAAAGLLLDDLRRDARERPPSLDLSAHGGAGGGLTFRP